MHVCLFCFTGEIEQIVSDISHFSLTMTKRLQLGEEMGIPPSELKGIELMVAEMHEELARRKTALAGMVKYWFENNREASFKKLADILETKMNMPLKYTVESFLAHVTQMEDDLVEPFLKLNEPLPNVEVLGKILLAQDFDQFKEKNEINEMNIIKYWIACCHEKKQDASCGLLKKHMQKAKENTGEVQENTAAASPSAGIIINYYNTST